MNTTELQQSMKEIVDIHGPWTAHNIRLHEDVYTMHPTKVGSAGGVRRFLQMIGDITGKPMSNLRILDLGCLEGLYALEAARHGAQAVGIDARNAHIAKANFAKEVLQLPTASFFVDDARHITPATYGLFDAILCVGLLYHLDVPDVFDLLERMYAMCTRCVIIETHISTQGLLSVAYKGHQYTGKKVHEHDARSSMEDRMKNTWASIDNPESFWLTKISLLNALSHAGFTSVYECWNPPLEREATRCTLVAIKGVPHRMLLPSPLYTHWPSGDWDEDVPRPLVG